VGGLGSAGAGAAEAEAVDFFGGKNEAIGTGVVGLGFGLMHFDEVGGLFELLVLDGAAGALEVAQEMEGAFELAIETVAVDAEVGEGSGLGVDGGGDGEGLLNLAGRVVEGIGKARATEGEEIVLKSGDAVEAPCSVGEGLDEVGFGGAVGVVFVGEGLHVALVGFEILTGEDDDLAGETVAEGVEGRAALAVVGFGSGGVLRVLAVDL